jgi:hypothetical protein
MPKDRKKTYSDRQAETARRKNLERKNNLQRVANNAAAKPPKPPQET